MPSEIKKCCGTCWWSYDWYPTKHNPPRVNKNFSGKCSFPRKRVLNNLPDSYKTYGWNDPKASHVQFDLGNTCTCWRVAKATKFLEVEQDED